MPALLTPSGAGQGEGWTRLAEALATTLPVAQVDRIWVFRVIRRDGRDWGTAVLSEIEGDRRRIYTAGFVHTVKGKKRGQFEWRLDEVGSGPVEALDELLALVPKRAEDEEPPTPIDRDLWFPGEAQDVVEE